MKRVRLHGFVRVVVLLAVLLFFNGYLPGFSPLPSPALGQETCVPAPSNLVSWWPGDGSADDFTGTNNGTLVNGASFAPGKVGQAFSLDGVDDYVSVPDSAGLNPTSEMTFDGWFYPLPDNEFQAFVSKGPDPPEDYEFVWIPDGGYPGHFIIATTTSERANWQPVATIASNQWHFIAMTYKSGQWRVFYDGQWFERSDVTGNLLDNTHPLLIGADLDSGGTRYMKGLIDEVEIYNRALTTSEVESIFNAGGNGKCKESLFQLSRTFLPTFPLGVAPIPAAYENFGYSIATLGSSILVGTPSDGSTDVGKVYLFDTNGALFNTFQNPTPAINDRFGHSVAWLGDRILIGAPGDDTGAVDAGAAYLFDGTTGTLIRTLEKRSTNAVQQVPVGVEPGGVGVNSNTNRIYVSNDGSDTVSVIDGVSNSVVATIDVGQGPEYHGGGLPDGVGVNPLTNRIYVANSGLSTVSVIDGVTNSVTATIALGTNRNPSGVGVNPNTNRIYVANRGVNTVSVVDGTTNAVIATIGVGSHPAPISVNPNTNIVYVGNGDSNTVSVIDGATNTVIATIGVGSTPAGVGVNPNTNRIYVANSNSASVSVIDGATNSVLATVGLGIFPLPIGVGVNERTNRIYVANIGTSTVSVIDGSNNAVVATIGSQSGARAVGVDPNSNRIYCSNSGSNTVSVLVDLVPVAGDQFGWSVAQSGGNILVGTPYDDAGASDAGTVYLFSSSDGSLLRVFPNPAPAVGDGFGWSLASVGGNILVGAPFKGGVGSATGTAYLLEAAMGSLVGIFEDPAPRPGNHFGWSVASVGNNFVIGSPQLWFQGEGRAFLYDGTTRQRIRNFVNPDVAYPALDDDFGRSVAGFGNKVLIGAPGDDVVASDAGAVFLFDASADGTLLRTFREPYPPHANDRFGWSVAGIAGGVTVGAPYDDTGATDAGSMFLFDDTTGALRYTFQESMLGSGDDFGFSIASKGDDRVIIGARYDDTGAADAGAVYLFESSTGSLIRKIPNPTPAPNDQFGWAVASVGANVLVGAIFDDTGATDAGAAYLFDGSTGVLLRTFQKPTPSASDWFGISVAAFGSNVLVGALFDDAGGVDVGAVYLFDGSTGALLRTFQMPPLTATIPTGSQPFPVDVNPNTNRVYVGNLASNTVSVINGSSNSILATINVSPGPPTGVSVNPVTNRIYVTNEGAGTLLIIDGATNTLVDTVVLGDGPGRVAVNPNTNRIYVGKSVSNSVSVIDGATNAVIANVAVGSPPNDIGVNPLTNRIYVTDRSSHTVSVIDGNTNTVTTTIQVGGEPTEVGINPVTNTIYVSSVESNTVTVINGATNAIVTTIQLGSEPTGIGVNPGTNRIYVGRGDASRNGGISVIDISTNSIVASVELGAQPAGVRVNLETNRVYVANRFLDTVSVFEDIVPGTGDSFGFSVAVVGSNVLVGAPNDDTHGVDAGAAYLFDGSTGALLRTFQDPTPAPGNQFGYRVAALGSNVLVGTPNDDTGAVRAGAAYLFDSSTGALLRTFANPTPATDDNFGFYIAAVGSNVVVGARWDDTGAVDSGAAYLFDGSTGTLITTILNPTPAAGDGFGWSVASVGSNIVVGAPLDDTRATNAGAAYLFSAVSDSAVTGIDASRDFAYSQVVSEPVKINVTVANQGLTPINVTVSVKANTTVIGTRTLTLVAGESMVVGFDWDAQSMARGIYLLSAEVPPSTGEPDTADNTLSGSVFTVRQKGDLNNDCVVNFLDLGTVGALFLTSSGQPGYNPEADFNFDGAINFLDLGIVGSNFLTQCT